MLKHISCLFTGCSLIIAITPIARYELTGKFILECEPRHSGPCITEYWEYKIGSL